MLCCHITSTYAFKRLDLCGIPATRCGAVWSKLWGAVSKVESQLLIHAKPAAPKLLFRCTNVDAVDIEAAPAELAGSPSYQQLDYLVSVITLQYSVILLAR
jgi:hypothetical protein